MSMSVEVKEINKFRKLMKKYGDKLSEAAIDEINYGAAAIQETAVELVQNGPASGKTYMSGKNGDIEHQASAPGEPPMADKGGLVGSLGFDVYATNKRPAIVAAKEEYAKYLEFGTIDMEPRPFMSVAYAMHIDDILKNVKAALRRTNAR